MEGAPVHRVPPLTAFQTEVARVVFQLSAARHFLVAGGAALVAQRLTDRPTGDVDLFTERAEQVIAARYQLDEAAAERGWSVVRVHDAPTFCRLVVRGPEDVLVDIALDAGPVLPPQVSPIGRTFAPEELAGRKLLALFDRAEARNFADVFVLAERYGKDVLLAQASGSTSGWTTVTWPR